MSEPRGGIWVLLVAASLVAGACVADGEAAEQPETTATVAVDTTATVGTTGTTIVADEPSEVSEALVGMSILAPAKALDLAASGFRDAAERCETVNIDIVERNANGDIPALSTIVEDFLAARVDLITTVTTPAAQAAHEVVGSVGGTTPVVYAVVTDPFSAGLAEDPSTHEPWITGSQSLPPFTQVMDAAQEIVPDLQEIGVVYSPDEANSESIVATLQEIARERGLTIELATVADSSEVGQAAQDLVGRGVDAFVVPTDTTVVSGLAGMAKVAGDNDLLVIATDANIAADGAAIGLGTDYYGSGFRAGGIACRVLSGEATPADFDVVNIESLGVAINEASVEAQNITIPQHLLEVAEILE